MRGYKIVAGSAKARYAGNKTDAATFKAAFVHNGFSRKEVEVTEIEIPTSKTELLAFLNGDPTNA